jgi:hypothetical protein
VVRELYNLAAEAIQGEKRSGSGRSAAHPKTDPAPGRRGHGHVRRHAHPAAPYRDDHATQFRSDGFTRFFQMLAKRAQLFVRPQRCDEDGRTVELYEGEPLPTSYGADL